MYFCFEIFYDRLNFVQKLFFVQLILNKDQINV